LPNESAIVAAMRARPLALLSLLSLTVCGSLARAEQRRDWVLDNAPVGNHLFVDYFGTGAQATLEHRGPIYGDANSYALNVSSLISYPAGQVQATASLRVLFLELGGSVGYRSVWRNMSFEPGDDGAYCKGCDAEARRDLDPLFGSTPGTDAYPFAEGNISLYALLNEHMVFGSLFSAHYEDGLARSYDNYYTNIHDGGLMLISETSLFFKHRDWGGIAPYIQVLSLPRAGRHETEVAWGFNAVTRLGLIPRNDALFVSLLLRPQDENYGQHSYYLPLRVVIAYRLMLEL
jgi:hypothetical protein